LEYLPYASTLDEEEKAGSTPPNGPPTELSDIGAWLLALAALQCFQCDVTAGRKLDDWDTHGFIHTYTIEHKNGR
jgi:hypothetical protein